MLKSLISKLPNPLRSLAVRFDSSPIANSDQLTDFLQTRSAYVAQTSLYGYLKTRMGTSFRQYFEDDAFSQSIRVAAIKVYESCLADLTTNSDFACFVLKINTDGTSDNGDRQKKNPDHAHLKQGIQTPYAMDI